MAASAREATETLEIPDVLPVLPLKDVVVFPYLIVPLSIAADRGGLAVDHALSHDRLVMLVSQSGQETEDPGPDDLYAVGTVGLILRMLKLPDGRRRILVQGVSRARLEQIGQREPFLQARIERLEEPEAPDTLEVRAMARGIREQLEEVAQLGQGMSSEVMVLAANLDEPGRLADLAAGNLELPMTDAQELLETLDPLQRLHRVSQHLHREIHLLALQQEISSQAREAMDQGQREYFLRQQLKTIREELGDIDELAEEIEGYRKQAEEKGLPEEAREELDKQLRRLERSHPDSAENAVIRSYLDWLVGLPWQVCSEDNLDLDHAKEVLDRDHYGLKKVKERILEFLAVRKLRADSKGPILCLVGPPGVGKTSLGRSVAEALGRKFLRLSLGGVRDEAEVRGHRRTYVGALPGRILQGLQQAGTSNPVFMLDEIDKLGSDLRGDPSSALLEVLDPEQNDTFRDHYLGVPYDLSQILFITTANLLEPIQPAFLDRMEVIRLSGYTEQEKLAIAERHLIPKQLLENGLKPTHLRFSKPGTLGLIRGYTREAGLRNLEREIAAICRKVAVQVAAGKNVRRTLGPRTLESFLGPEKHYQEEMLDRDRVGVATGLAWTASGGEIMLIEVAAVPGKGQLVLTGHLGEVMQESARAALTYARSFAATHGYEAEFFAKNDLHVHAPAGGIPKDGPSAGITMTTAIVSVLTGIPVNRRIAMTGEVTLRGEVLPIGGLKEKALGARAAGLNHLLIPSLNERDVKELPPVLKEELHFETHRHMSSVLAAALVRPPKGTDRAATTQADKRTRRGSKKRRAAAG